MMKILFLAEALSPHISRWQAEFARLGWETLTASCDFTQDFTGRRLVAKAERGPLRYLALVDQVKELIVEFRPHIVNAHFLPTYGLTAALANVHPLVLTLWGSDILVSGGKSTPQRLRSRFVLRRADLVVADAECLMDAAAALGGIRNRLVVSFGVRTSWFESGQARVLSDVSILQILSCRRFEKLYDIETLIRAAKILMDDSVPFHLTLVGSGSQERPLRSLVGSLKLESMITFAGTLTDEQLFSLYRRSDVYVSTALSDSTSVSLLEALSQKLYPVVTDIPGNREWLPSRQFLFRAGDAEELAEKIKFGSAKSAREEAYLICLPTLQQKGIREEQMRVADLAFRKLIDDYPHG